MTPEQYFQGRVHGLVYGAAKPISPSWACRIMGEPPTRVKTALEALVGEGLISRGAVTGGEQTYVGLPDADVSPEEE